MPDIERKLCITTILIAAAASGFVAAQGPRPPLFHEWMSAQPRVNDAFGDRYAGIGDVDDMERPIMQTVDKTFLTGTFGLGSFDDTGTFDNIRLWAKTE